MISTLQTTSNSGINWLVTKFIEGGPAFMSCILLCLIIGFYFVIERMVVLFLSHKNTTKMQEEITQKLATNQLQEALSIADKQLGPIGKIYHETLLQRAENQKIEAIEKHLVSIASIEISKLEKNLSWIGLFIVIAPMLGFIGTVIGMIDAFDLIQKDTQVEISGMAKNIKVALITTFFGLVVAVILQISYTFINTKIDSLVREIEEVAIKIIQDIKKHIENEA